MRQGSGSDEKEPKLDKKRYSRKEVAELVGVDQNTIYRREKSGKVTARPIRIVHSKDLYYPPEVVMAHWKYQHAEEVA